MADQDDFETGGRAWRKLERMYVDESCPAEQVAAELQSRVALMLRICNGISILPELLSALLDYGQELTARSLWRWQSGETPETELEAKLQAFENLCASRRLEMVAIRSARSLAVKLAAGHLALAQPIELAERIVIDVARHRCLERARALAIGKRFPTGLESYAFYEEVTRRFVSHARRMGASLLNDPTGKTVKRDRAVLRTSTRNIMFEGDLSI